MKKYPFSGILGLLAMLILILDRETATYGAAEGLALCIKSVIPSLFPFFFFSIMLSQSMGGIDLPVLKPLGNLLGIPEGFESLLINSFLGGYPTGAQAISIAYSNGSLSKDTSERLLAFSNNAGPSFLFGIIAPMFSDGITPWILWIIHILSAILTSFFFPVTDRHSVYRKRSTFSLINVLNTSIKVMASVCAWIIVFRVIICFLNIRLFSMLPAYVKIILTGILELSNGCQDLSLITDYRFRMIACSLFLSFGGICVTLQTKSVCEGLSLRNYAIGKVLQTIIAVSLTLIALSQIGWVLFLLILIMILFRNIKTYRFSSESHV